MLGSLVRVLAPAVGCLLLQGCAGIWGDGVERDSQRNIYLHEIKKGDTLREIAWKYGLTVDQLQAWNDIDNPRTLQVGTQLVLNPPSSGQGAAAEVAESDTGGSAAAEEPAPQTSAADGPPGYDLDWIWPAEGPVERAYATDSGGKSGIQIGGSEGDPIRAAEDGEVVYSGSGLRGYGNLIIVMHDERYLSAYGYNRRLLVEEGAQVSRGDRIAEMGYAPGAESASLHFEIRVDGDAVDPEAHLPERG